jgi:hypothetical protein
MIRREEAAVVNLAGRVRETIPLRFNIESAEKRPGVTRRAIHAFLAAIVPRRRRIALSQRIPEESSGARATGGLARRCRRRGRSTGPAANGACVGRNFSLGARGAQRKASACGVEAGFAIGARS